MHRSRALGRVVILDELAILFFDKEILAIDRILGDRLYYLVWGDGGPHSFHKHLRFFYFLFFGGSPSRITHFELSALKGKVPSIINGLETDKIYEDEEPVRNQEVLQSWESLKKLNGLLTSGTQTEGLQAMKQIINKAKGTYDQIRAVPSALDTKSNDEHLEPLEEALRLFCKHAEIDLPTN